ncbi:enoyl-CoA hydratase/isomerase family protein [Streptomyces sp. NBC_01728]|uniref:enoyl-CoA hydratase/isomerase family protein n=1 Tax=unclassified Streptomyces TaxID=2593676 RepID=UPI00225A42BE|nr:MULTISPECIES: enoyl-CoA hydratase/isomerase family protein [unclassified Streptomyces]MCX4460728.1 enoyl-CoA hydratase/isomerase family protein [Streptomyces sp. NBC_01719]MCX4499942.1 enoyl-CoA hydratase/isomerase family protein [Streptomyces sp. NBC_01728]
MILSQRLDAAAPAGGARSLVGVSFDADLAAMSERLRPLVDLVDSLPEPAARTEHQHAIAASAHHDARELRKHFLATHTDRLYAELTEGFTLALTVEQIADRAARRCPGLVPTPDRMSSERRLPQRAKEGWEIDLGLLFNALFGSPAAGTHLLRSMLAPTPQALSLLPGFRSTGQADLGLATVTRRDGVAHLELRNDAYLNAEDDAAVEALETGTDLVLLDENCHVGVLRGAAMTHPARRGRRVFSAGINLTHLYEGKISLLGFMVRREVGYISKYLRGLWIGDTGETGDWEMTTRVKPWVGAIDGFAIGGGMQILPVLDRIVAADDAWFSLPAMEEGLVPGVANLRLGTLMGGRTARQLIFWGRRVRADEPEAALVCDDVVAPDAMDAAVDRAAQHLDNPAVAANRRMMVLGEEPLDLFRRYMARYVLEQAQRMHSADLTANLERTWIGRNGRPGGAARS